MSENYGVEIKVNDAGQNYREVREQKQLIAPPYSTCIGRGKDDKLHHAKVITTSRFQYRPSNQTICLEMAPSRISPEPSTATQGLTEEQLTTFEQDGYLIVPDALSPETVSALLTETHSLLDNFSLDDHPMTKFSTGESSDHVGDDYFLSSGDKVRFFFEEGHCPRCT